MRELRPTPRLRAVLRRVNTVRFPLSVLGRSHGRVMPMTRHVVSRRLNLAAITTPATSHYRRAVAEMVRAFRTETGEPLGPALLLAVRKWANSGLDPDLLQELACDLFDRFEAAGRLPPRPKGVAPAPRQRRRPKRTYEQSLGRGRTTHARAFPAEVQAASHGQAIAA
ncbi:hypothetical protein FJY71_05130, partial [candidate division WOR-3 bacterium]|nr:hypothetical protein [candidate division WOR-3 bacterium]